MTKTYALTFEESKRMGNYRSPSKKSLCTIRFKLSRQICNLSSLSIFVRLKLLNKLYFNVSEINGIAVLIIFILSKDSNHNCKEIKKTTIKILLKEDLGNNTAKPSTSRGR